MSSEHNLKIAQTLLEGIGSSRDPEEIAAPFAANLLFEIQGDDNVLPWIGVKKGRPAMADFVRDLRNLTEPLEFSVEDILAGDTPAAIIGSLRSRLRETGSVMATQFAIILTIADGVVTRFQMLEDSFAVSKAVRKN